MDKIKFKLKVFTEWFIEWFVFIATGILIICAVQFSLVSDGKDIPGDTLLQIIISAFLTAVVTAVFILIEPVKKSSVIICMILHFCFLNGIMILCGVRFGWIDFVSFGIMDMVISVVAVYAFVVAVYYILDKHHANQINHRLREKYKDDEV